MIIQQSAVVSTPSSKGSSGAMYTSEDGSQCDSSMMTSKSTPKGFQSTPNNYHSGLAPLFQEIQARNGERYCKESNYTFWFIQKRFGLL